jgi:prepilin-type processing-associated H-X9-DG protein
LNDTRLGTVIEDLLLQVVEIFQDSEPREQRIASAEIVDVLKQVARDGFVLGVTRIAQDDFRWVAAFRCGDRPVVRRLLEIAGAPGRPAMGQAMADPAVISVGRHTFRRFGAEGVWLVQNGDLVLTKRNNFEEISAVIRGKRPSALEHPLRAALAQADDGIQPAAIGFLDPAAVKPLPPDAVVLGLDGLQRIDLQWGFQDAALVTRLRLTSPMPRRGLLALLDQPTFGINTLPPLPANLTGLFVLSIDLANAYDQIDTLMKRISPPSPTDPPSAGILARHGIDLRKELLGHVDSPLAFYVQSPQGEEGPTVAALLMSRVAGFTLAAQIRDEAAASRAIDSLIKSFNPMLRQFLRGIQRNRVASSLAFLKFEMSGGPHPKYTLDLPADSLPQPYLKALRPTVMLGRHQLVVSASTRAAEQALAGGPRWQPDGAFAPVVKRLPADMVYLGLTDPRAGTAVFTKILPILVRQINAEIALAQRRLRNSANEVVIRLDPDMIPPAEELNRLLFPSSTTLSVDGQGATLTHREAIPTLTSPATAAVVIALLVPSVRSSWEASRRVQCVNNLKQIALAMHNYHAATNAFPRPAILDEKGKPLLSWRVAILPYIDQKELYDKFKRDEPWDSPHNKSLLKEMPPTYGCPIRTAAEPFTTTYRVLVGQGALFERDQDIGVADVTDGTSNTIMVVEAKEAVPWTKPDDLSFDPAAVPSLGGAGSSHPGGFNASMADGSVRFFKSTINLNTFRALITRAGGEVIRADAF